MMNDIFREYLNGFVVIHLNDVLIFFKNEKKIWEMRTVDY